MYKCSLICAVKWQRGLDYLVFKGSFQPNPNHSVVMILKQKHASIPLFLSPPHITVKSYQRYEYLLPEDAWTKSNKFYYIYRLCSHLWYGTIKVQQPNLCSKHCHASGLVLNLVWKIFTENKPRHLALPWVDLNVPAGFPGVAVRTGLNNFSSIFASFTYWHDFPSNTMLLRTLRDINLEKKLFTYLH